MPIIGGGLSNDRIHTCVEMLEKDIKRFIDHMPWEGGRPRRITLMYDPAERFLEFTGTWEESNGASEGDGHDS